MSNKFILTDIDGCLLDWCSSFVSYMEKLGYVEKPNADSYYFLNHRYYNLPMDKVYDVAHEFNSSDDFKNLKAYKDAIYGVNQILSLGYDIFCVTSVGLCDNVKNSRIENLNAVFGDGIFNKDNVMCVPLGESKMEHLKKWAGTKALWVEDHFMNAEAGYEVGLSPILVDTSYNRHYSTDLFPRTSRETPWKDILKYLNTL